VTLTTLCNKPEYWFRPSQILRKFRFKLRSKHDTTNNVRLPWGPVLSVRAGDAIGRGLLTLGVHELAVSEVLWRLTDVGDACLDLGANIGYMTSLLSVRVGPAGRVFSFEPHPEVIRHLERNIRGFPLPENVSVLNEAVGMHNGVADLFEGIDFKSNEGTASLISEASRTGERHRVTVRSLDALFPSPEKFGIMKVDVEGAELETFQGASRMLSEHRVRDIVWEDHHPFPSESVELLADLGYHIFQFTKKLRGPHVWDPFTARDSSALPWETTNYLATIEPERARSRLQVRGWSCLSCG
jgi:FkbM family methyltransferase